MKKILCLVLATIMILSTAVIAVSAEEEKIGVSIDGKTVNFTDAVPFVENGRTLIPLRAVSEAMNAEVDWNEETQEITVSKDGVSYFDGKIVIYSIAIAVLKVGTSKMTIKMLDLNAEKEAFSVEKELDTCAKIVDGRTYIPARFVGYAMGYDVEWKNDTVCYTFTAEQTLDFEIQKQPEITQQPQTTENSEQSFNPEYPNPIEYNPGEIYYYKDGYGDIKVLDGDNGHLRKIGNTGELGDPLNAWSFMPINYTFRTNDYIFDTTKTPEENLAGLAKMFEDKTDITYTNISNIYQLNSPYYKFNFETHDDLGGIWFDPETNIYNMSTKGFDFDARYIYNMYEGEKHYGVGCGCPYDRSGTKLYLLMLENLLGETGEKIWTMMYDYRLHLNHFNTGEIEVNTSDSETELKNLQIKTSDCEYYGLNCTNITNYTMENGIIVPLMYNITLENNGKKIVIIYGVNNQIMSSGGFIVLIYNN